MTPRWCVFFHHTFFVFGDREEAEAAAREAAAEAAAAAEEAEQRRLGPVNGWPPSNLPNPRESRGIRPYEEWRKDDSVYYTIDEVNLECERACKGGGAASGRCPHSSFKRALIATALNG